MSNFTLTYEWRIKEVANASDHPEEAPGGGNRVPTKLVGQEDSDEREVGGYAEGQEGGGEQKMPHPTAARHQDAPNTSQQQTALNSGEATWGERERDRGRDEIYKIALILSNIFICMGGQSRVPSQDTKVG